MSATQYRKVECNNCGKLLGYIYIKTTTVPPKELYRLFTGQPYQKSEIVTLCPECYHKAQTE